MDEFSHSLPSKDQEKLPHPNFFGADYPSTDPSVTHPADLELLNAIEAAGDRVEITPLGNASKERETTIDLSHQPLLTDEQTSYSLAAVIGIGPDKVTRLWTTPTGEVFLDPTFAAETGPVLLPDGQTVVIGRQGQQGNSLGNLPDTVSRRHFEITRSGTSVTVRDLSAPDHPTNGTYVVTRHLERAAAVAQMDEPRIEMAVNDEPVATTPEQAERAADESVQMGVEDLMGVRKNMVDHRGQTTLRDKKEGRELLLGILHLTEQATREVLSPEAIAAIAQNRQRGQYFEPAPLSTIIEKALPRWEPKRPVHDTGRQSPRVVAFELDRVIKQLEAKSSTGGEFVTFQNIDEMLGPALEVLVAQQKDGQVTVPPRVKELIDTLRR